MKMNVKLLIIIMLFKRSTKSDTFFEASQRANFINDYFNQRHVKVIAVFACSVEESIDIFKTQMNNRTIVSKHDFFDTEKWFTKVMAIPVGIIGVYLNNSCNFGKSILLKSSEMDMFTAKYVWLVMNENVETIEKLNNLKLRLDSDMTLAIINNTSNSSVYSIDSDYNLYYKTGIDLYELYKLQDNLLIIVKYIGHWNTEVGLAIMVEENVVRRRQDLNGITVSGISVIAQLNLTNTTEDEKFAIITNADHLGHLDILNRYPFIIIMLLTKLYNFNINVTFTNNWGFVREIGKFDGMIGDLQQGNADIGLSPVAVNKSRFEVIDFSFPIYLYRPIFMFRNARTFGTYEALLIPFKKGVWVAVIALILIFIILLMVINRVHVPSTTDAVYNDKSSRSWSESLVIIFGAFFTQGLVSSLKRLSERILLYIVLIVGILILIYYNSMITKSLLQPPPTNIINAENILESDLQIGVVNITYYKIYFEMAEDRLSKCIYNRKLKHKEFMYEPEVGVELIRNTSFAYYGDDVIMYPIIANTFTTDEICSLVEVELIKGVHLMTPIRKNFPLKRHINYGLHYLRETGIIMRERTRWNQHKPICQGQIYVPSIQLQTLTVAYVIMLFGICLSVLLLVFEILIYKHYGLKHNKVDST